MYSTISFVLALAATVAVSLPSPMNRREVRVAARQSNNELTETFAGAFLTTTTGTITSASASFSVPGVKTPAGGDFAATASVFVGLGMDMFQCSNSFMGGIIASTNSGSSTFAAVGIESDGQIIDIPNFIVSAGDDITMSINATDSTTGTVHILNQNTGGIVSLDIPTDTVCSGTVSWLVTDLVFGGNLAPLAAFGTVDFVDASAQTSSGPLDLSGATVLDMIQNNVVLTSSTLTSSTVSVLDLNAV
ncbi:uncharacterized protein PHACADRAFT_192524 [Phanerochaete carnosa HHB-10118-sp]|uniref:Uncharacterized protein n=1 Tax=Phanerochaete carnosa (strain HHB-10118-sp) TaxID=650164 RepID=K5XB04_PHACS|nr:uncharacterized protein PHACADRAFT_192524 [Phanerochaete carnosa HHB-10118-sp]EKM60122.1 hypothetical protein PHACADRAFT_192524 [Phanerochaete carnosa HHB-10118-sp]